MKNFLLYGRTLHRSTRPQLARVSKLRLERLEPRLLLAAGDVVGTIFADLNGDGSRNDDEGLLAGINVYLDINANGQLDAGEPFDTSTASLNSEGGNYRIEHDLAVGATVNVRVDGNFDRLTSPTLRATEIDTARLPTELPPEIDIPAATQVQDIEAADFNGDGVVDVAIMQGKGIQQISLFLADPITGALASTPSATIAVTDGGAQLASGNLDGTGGADLVVLSPGQNRVTLYRFNPQAGFTELGNFNVTNPTDALVADVDPNTGNDEVIVISGASSQLTVIKRTGQSQFQTTSPVPSGGDTPIALTSGDFNRDGKLDIAITHVGSRSVSVLTGDGAGGFSFANSLVGFEVVSKAEKPSPFVLAAGHFVGDNTTLDLAVIDGLVVSIFSGDGDGNFTRTSSIIDPSLATFDSEGTPSRIVAGDLDGDGDSDIVLSVIRQDRFANLIVYENQSNGFVEIVSSQIGVALDFGHPVPISLSKLPGGEISGFAVGAHHQTEVDSVFAEALRYYSTGRRSRITLDATANRGNDFLILAENAPLDFGDAPPAYPVTLAQNGARHPIGTLVLGTIVDAEADGQPTLNADGDGSDEDGVVVNASLISAAVDTISSLSVISSGPGKLDAWIDFNNDGDWSDAGEQIFTSTDVVAGDNLLSFNVPAGSTSGSTGARFRLSTAGGLAPTGAAADGEVEDYLAVIVSGSATAALRVDVPSGDTQVVVEGDDLVVRNGTTIISQVPFASFGELNLNGSSLDDVLQLTILEALTSRTLIIDGGLGKDFLELTEAWQTLDLTNASVTIRDVEGIDIRGTGNNTLVISIESVKAASSTTDTLEVVSNAGDAITFGPDWRADLPQFIDGQFTHVISEVAEDGTARVELRDDRFFTNPLNPFDVDRNGSVQPLDALRIINAIRRLGSGPIALPTNDGEISNLYFDVSGDNNLTALDALRVINAISRINRGFEPEGESVLVDLNAFANNTPKPRDIIDIVITDFETSEFATAFDSIQDRQPDVATIDDWREKQEPDKVSDLAALTSELEE